MRSHAWCARESSADCNHSPATACSRSAPRRHGPAASAPFGRGRNTKVLYKRATKSVAFQAEFRGLPLDPFVDMLSIAATSNVDLHQRRTPNPAHRLSDPAAIHHTRFAPVTGRSVAPWCPS